MAGNFVIEERTGEKRIVVLRGRSLPFQGVTYALEQRVDINFFPGNPVATSQILGPTFEPLEIKGRWSDVTLTEDESSPIMNGFTTLSSTVQTRTDTRSGLQRARAGLTEAIFRSSGSLSNQNAVLARDIVSAMKQILRAGQMLRVEWESEVRFGHMRRFAPTYDRIEDINWEMEFDWVGDTDIQPKPEAQVVDTTSILKRMIGFVEDLISVIRAVNRIAERYVQKFVGIITKMGSLIEELIGAVETTVSLALSPISLIGTMISTFKGIQQAAIDAITVLRVDTPTIFVSTFGNPIIVSDMARLQQEVHRKALIMGAEASEAQIQFERFESQDILEIVTIIAGQTLRDVAAKSYGASESWRIIAEFNGFPSSVVAPGSLVRVPRI